MASVLAMVGLAALGLAVLGGVLASGRSLWGKVSLRATIPGATAQLATPAFVLVTFSSTPAGARIVDAAGRTVGTTPATLPVAPSQIVVSFRFQLDGYAEATASAVPDSDKTISVELTPAQRADKPGRKPRSAKRPHPSAP